jgi:hypothetical protein
LVALGIALLSRVRGVGWLRSSGWLVAAVGLFGVSALYAQATLDGRTLTLALTVVIALQFVGLLLAFVRADGPARSRPASQLAVMRCTSSSGRCGTVRSPAAGTVTTCSSRHSACWWLRWG